MMALDFRGLMWILKVRFHGASPQFKTRILIMVVLIVFLPALALGPNSLVCQGKTRVWALSCG